MVSLTEGCKVKSNGPVWIQSIDGDELLEIEGTIVCPISFADWVVQIESTNRGEWNGRQGPTHQGFKASELINA
jgi:hypothetical protein